jgi:hypothetical protein
MTAMLASRLKPLELRGLSDDRAPCRLVCADFGISFAFSLVLETNIRLSNLH